jgi:ABC-type proline/glycine betaine transport system permease subunit
MHERYFYLADVLTIVMAFYVRRYWPVAVLVSACSLLSYAPFLWQRTIVALPLVAFAEFLAVIATGLFFVTIMRRGGDRLLRQASSRTAASS